ncbi:response regulator [Grimontia marina]|uniref:Sensor histidine kinase RcsC n=1 Tax=Grimontia marina TaxID=646534 RepID=A0A128F1D2_9GAMM|nr:response regulator [Grimontia marina]CZF80597.1 Sensor histidine kinase RcsC [Grimontia marina]
MQDSASIYSYLGIDNIKIRTAKITSVPIELQRLHPRIFLTGVADNVTYLSSGAEALAYYKKNLFQILVTDVSMPNIDGYELTAQLR